LTARVRGAARGGGDRCVRGRTKYQRVSLTPVPPLSHYFANEVVDLSKRSMNISALSRATDHTNEYAILKVEELDGRAVSALGVRSRKLSTGLNGQS
jgi:hypothetical protein